MLGTLSGWAVGLLLGMRHALEPDHVAAVSTLVAEHRASRAGLILGAAWGLGHTLTLLLVGGALLLLRVRMPEPMQNAFELVVAMALIALGIKALARALRAGAAAPHAHRHHDPSHAHRVGATRLHPRGWTIAQRPLLLGSVHGLAGSGALTAAVMAQLPSASAALVYMGMFAVGSSMGMAALTGAAGQALSRLSHTPRAVAVLLGISGSLSLVLGVGWGCIHAARLMGS